MIRAFTPIVLPALVGLFLAGCAASQSGTTTSTPASTATNPAAKPPIAASYQGALPEYAERTPELAALYRWAAPNRSIMQYFQCTCGCESEAGHTSNWNCYVKEEKPGGEYVWDPMSAG